MWAKNKNTGFTIVELLIVVVIIGILAAIVVVAYNGVTAGARDSSRSSAVDTIKKALELYKVQNGTYPAVCSADNAGCSANSLATALSPFVAQVPQDPQYPTVRIDYVRGPATNDSYALYVKYETKPPCKTGNNVNTGWWGSEIVVC